MQFTGKVVLVTGASSGIGAGTAKQFAKLGANLALTDINSLDEIALECEALGAPKPFVINGNLTKDNDVKNIIDSTITYYGKLDVLINNAGILVNGSIETTNVEQYDKVMAINARCIYHMTNLAVPHLIKSQGCIVNVSSVNGIRSFPGILAYCMSKAAIDQFTRCVALELASKNVRVNAVNPGVILTNIHKNAGMDEKEYKTFLQRTKHTHAMGRPGQVEEVAGTITFLASSDASFITGVSLPVDGGRHAMCPR